MGEEVQLHGAWASPFNCWVVLALKLKGIEYEYIEEDLSNKSAQLLQHNPVHKKIPVLLHRGKPICESIIILEYIDQICPQINPLFPADPYDRALARFWLKFIGEKVSTIFPLFRSIEGKEKEKAINETLEMLEVIETQCLGKNKCFGGNNINAVDIAVGVIFHLLQVIERLIEVKFLQAEKFSHLQSWFDNFKDVPVVKDNLPDSEKMVALFKNLIKKF